MSYHNVALYTSMAVEVIVQTLKDASQMSKYRHLLDSESGVTVKQHNQVMGSLKALHFIQSTGFNVLIERYNLDYDADELREKFEQYFDIKPKS